MECKGATGSRVLPHPGPQPHTPAQARGRPPSCAHPAEVHQTPHPGLYQGLLTPPPSDRLICMPPPQSGHWRRRQEAGAEWLRGCGSAGEGLLGVRRPGCRCGCRCRCRRGTGSGPSSAPRVRRLQRESTERLPAMSRKKTPKSKGASATAASALPASNGPRPVRPGTARPGPETPLNRPPQPGGPSLGGGGDFYDVAFKVSGATPHASAAGGVRRELTGEWVRAGGQSGEVGVGFRALRTLQELAGAVPRR